MASVRPVVLLAGSPKTTSPERPFTELRLSPALIGEFIKARHIEPSTAEKIKRFYLNRDYQYAWFTEDGPTEQTYAFWNMHEQYLNLVHEGAFADNELHDRMKTLLEVGNLYNRQQIPSTELLLTLHFFEFASYAYVGKIDPEEMQWYIPRKKVNLVAVLDSMVQNKGKNPDKWEPVNRQYSMMKSFLIHYYDLKKEHDWSPIAMPGSAVLKIGDKSPMLPAIKLRLGILGDYKGDSSVFFTSDLESAVVKFQRRHGLSEDGRIGPEVIKTLNEPLDTRIRQLLINMERFRWIPQHSDEGKIVINIPEFKLHVYEQKKEVMSIDIVVGRAANRTVIFSDNLTQIVFSPYWNVPRSIVINEILPAMKRNASYLRNHDMEIVGYHEGIPEIRQRPGEQNALGGVKFLFPNRFNIYLHDTPAKSLFEKPDRAFSHGCIRLREPFNLAKYLLRDMPEWSDQRIRESMHLSYEKWVQLDNPVPVYIGYFTAWVDSSGELNFRKDVYGHDARMAKHLF